jgi:hypothetical protein
MKPIVCIFTLPIVIVAMACSLAAAGEPRVAVFVEEAFPYFGGAQSIPSSKLVERAVVQRFPGCLTMCRNHHCPWRLC